MQAFTIHQGLAVPLNRENIDTDAIIPKQFLKSIKRSGFGPNLFDEWRYLDRGEPGQDPAMRQPNPDFILNQDRYQGASVLVTGRNFGCGSSREHAPWALEQYGFRAIIAPSFADIFFNNCFKNGLLPIILDSDTVDHLFNECKPGNNLIVDLAEQTIVTHFGETIHFNIDPSRKHRLLNGLDDIDLTLQHAEAIRSFEAKRVAAAPWLFTAPR